MLRLTRAVPPLLAAVGLLASCTGGGREMAWPVEGRVSQKFGQGGHPGMDIAAPVGAPVWAADAGWAVRVDSGGGYNGGYGNLVVIDHAYGRQTRYAHLAFMLVSPGAWVAQGEQVGAVGMTGESSGPHLHFEVRQDGILRDPANYLP